MQGTLELFFKSQIKEGALATGIGYFTVESHQKEQWTKEMVRNCLIFLRKNLKCPQE